MKRRVHWRRSGIMIVVRVLIIAGCATADEAPEGTAAAAGGEATSSVEKEGWFAGIALFEG